jgi:hypothetical protein
MHITGCTKEIAYLTISDYSGLKICEWCGKFVLYSLPPGLSPIAVNNNNII